MRSLAFQLVLCFVAILVSATACTKKVKTDHGALEKAFVLADGAVQSQISKAHSALQAHDYFSATTVLVQVASTHKVTEQQRKALREAFGDISRAISANPNLDSPQFYRARTELKSLLYPEVRNH